MTFCVLKQDEQGAFLLNDEHGETELCFCSDAQRLLMSEAPNLKAGQRLGIYEKKYEVRG